MTEKKGTPIWKLTLMVVAGLPMLLCSLVGVAFIMSPDKDERLEPTIAAGEPATAVENAPPEVTPQHPTTRKWYEGGTLHKATGTEWRAADASNKLATCSDFLAKLWEGGRLSGKLTLTVKTIDDLKAPSEKCVEALDKAYESPADGADDVMATQDVASVALITMTMMGFIKSGT